MPCERRRGFTLIELLVVIAIIAILAAMLFPVFARARESARKIQCLSNVKNIATAVQMYLTDYDRFPPGQHDTAMLEAMSAATGRDLCVRFPEAAMAWGANPFLRWPVILDEYVRNRDVWRCPSSQHGARSIWVIPSYTSPWWRYYLDHVGEWGPGCSYGGPCWISFPPGWGGSVTDTIAQKTAAGEDSGAVQISIPPTHLTDRKTSEMTDPSWLVVCGDNVGQSAYFEQMFTSLYGSNPCCCWDLSEDEACRFWNDVSYRKQFAPHMGGLNLGFADGHASWWAGEAALAESPVCLCCSPWVDFQGSYNQPGGKMKGLCPPLPVEM